MGRHDCKLPTWFWPGPWTCRCGRVWNIQPARIHTPRGTATAVATPHRRR